MQTEKRPRVSICIPAYNAAGFIRETLESLLAQSETSIEIIVSDNASTDGTVEIVLRLRARDSRIVLRQNEQNVGYARNIMLAVQQARSDLVAIYHADDLYLPTIVEKEAAILETVGCVGGVFSLPATITTNQDRVTRNSFHANLHRTAPFLASRNAIVGTYEEFVPVFLKVGNIFACPSFMTRKAAFLELGGFTDRYPSNEDFELWLKYLKSGWSLAIVNEFLLNYRVSESQGSAIWRKKPELGKMYTVLQDMVVAGRVLTKEQQLDYSRNRAVGFARVAVESWRSGKRKEALWFSRLSRQAALLPLSSPWVVAQYVPWLLLGAQFLVVQLSRAWSRR